MGRLKGPRQTIVLLQGGYWKKRKKKEEKKKVSFMIKTKLFKEEATEKQS